MDQNELTETVRKKIILKGLDKCEFESKVKQVALPYHPKKNYFGYYGETKWRNRNHS